MHIMIYVKQLLLELRTAVIVGKQKKQRYIMIRYKVSGQNRRDDDKEIASIVDRSINSSFHHNIHASQYSFIHHSMIENWPKLDWLKFGLLWVISSLVGRPNKTYNEIILFWLQKLRANFIMALQCVEILYTISVIYTTAYFIKDSIINSAGAVWEESMHCSLALFLWVY